MTILSRDSLSDSDLKEVSRVINPRSVSAKKARARGARARRHPEDARQVSKFERASFQLQAFPVPLSECFNNFGKRRIDSERYTAWKGETDNHLRRKYEHLLGTPYRATFMGPTRVRYYVKRPDNRMRDLDNLLKALNDALTRNHIIEDDSKIVDLGIAWSESEMITGCVYVEIESVQTGIIREAV